MSQAQTRGEPVGSPEVARWRALLEVLLGAIGAHRTLPELIQEIADRLGSVVGCESVLLLLHDPSRDRLRLHVVGGRPTGLTEHEERAVDDTVSGKVIRSGKPYLVSSTKAKGAGSKAMALLADSGLLSAWYFPLSTPRRKLGVLGFCGSREGMPTERDQELLQSVANQVALAAESAIEFESSASERERLKLLLDVSAAIASRLDLKALTDAIALALKQSIKHEYTSLSLHEKEPNELRVHALYFDGKLRTNREGVAVPLDGTTPGAIAFASKAPFVTKNVDELRAFKKDFIDRLVAEGIRSTASVPLLVHGKVVGTLNAGSFREGAFTPGELELLAQVAGQIAPAVENAFAYREIEALKEKLSHEKVYLESELQHDFQEIVGDSTSLKKVLKGVETVAPTDSTVLISGETGTGKELIARAIHNLSGRKKGTFVKVNCAAIPTGLVESELFGHEKGAFTGALAQRIGRFELANGGTLFLDEVGDIPAELQPKLLRVLQEQEFERLGGTKTIKVNVRLVAATNRDLAQMVGERTFRNDLYYRLNVFPVSLPPLRERPGDVELLVRHFVAKCARKLGKKVDSVPTETMSLLKAYSWPGNVRELENFLERAVILSPGSTLEAPLAELRLVGESAGAPARAAVSREKSSRPNGKSGDAKTLLDVEREHIIKVLEESNWVVGGRKGAAGKLGITRTTLQGRMQKLGITRPK